MAEVPDRIHKIAATNCEPLFLSSPFMRDGHNSEKANGTITYIEFRGRLFGVTCAHIYDQQKSSGKWLTLHGKERYTFQLGKFAPTGYTSNFRSLRKENSTIGPDIAIIDLGESIKQMHFGRKEKQAINLDTWQEPAWSDIKVPVAFGYPTEHKSQIFNMLSSPLLAVAAEITSPLSPDASSFLLASSLTENNKFFFSGMSGGPVYYISDPDEAPVIIGIVFEGSPGSSAEWKARDSQSFLTKNDIQIRAHTLTPAIFEEWLLTAGFI